MNFLRKHSDFLRRTILSVGRHYAVGALVVLLLGVVGTGTDVAVFLQEQVSHPLQFRVRSLLVAEELDPTIRIYTYDDKTAAKVRDFDLPLGDWARVLKKISERNPRAILIDKLFDKPASPTEYEFFFRTVAGLPVYPIAFLTKPIQHREDLGPTVGLDGTKLNSPEPSGNVSSLRAYGAKQELTASFAGFGHAVYAGDGYVHAILTTEEGRSFPHIGILGKDALTMTKGRLAFRNKPVVTDAKGRILVNLVSPTVYENGSISALSLFSRALRDKDIEEIKPGDTVVVLPAMYTGHTDWRDTPHGSVPGGYINVAVTHSALNGAWLRTFEHQTTLTLVLSLIFILLAVKTSLKQTPWVLASLLLAFVTISFVCFVWGSVDVPWVLPSITATTASLLVFIGRSRIAHDQGLRMAIELETARIVQESLFTEESKKDAAFRLECYRRPASECSGDWWTSFPTADGRQFVLLGDAVGHGVGAALITAMAFATTALVSRDDTDKLTPSAILRHLNYVLCQSPNGKAGMTMIVALFDLQKRTVTVASAGHPFAYKVGKETPEAPSRVSMVKAYGSLLGIADDLTFEEAAVTWNPGDILCLYSDGIIEIPGKNGTPLTRRGLKSLLEPLAQKTRPDFLRFLGTVSDYFPTTMLDDDQTLLIVHFDPNSPAASII